jgi:ArsR family metal-binding transcriptional regulator
MLLAPCVADTEKVRIIAHTSGDLSQVFPYLNAEMQSACYNAHAPNLTFMDGYRMISLYSHRIAVAKPDEIVDAWRTLEMIRLKVNDVWRRRHEIEPCYELRARPPALEIFKRLPRTNCGECGELTCLAFASKVWLGQAAVDKCPPVFGGEYGHLKDALLEICQGLGTALESGGG